VGVSTEIGAPAGYLHLYFSRSRTYSARKNGGLDGFYRKNNIQKPLDISELDFRFQKNPKKHRKDIDPWGRDGLGFARRHETGDARDSKSIGARFNTSQH
jgi:hypothetical protein